MRSYGRSMGGLTGGLTGGLEKLNSLIVICLAKNTGGLGKNDEIHVLLKILNSLLGYSLAYPHSPFTPYN